MKNKVTLLLVLLCLKNVLSQNVCNNAVAFCDSVIVPSMVNTGMGQPGPNYGCLGTAPNCSWFYTQVVESGNIVILLSGQQDVDFVCWGPFTSLSAACSNMSSSNIVDCSYSIASSETLTIPNAVAGQYYIFISTNFSNTFNPVLIKKISGTGSVCSPFTGIKGNVYKDMDSDCLKTLSDLPLNNVPLKLFDNLGNLIAQTNSNIYGEYWFSRGPGTYSLTLDTSAGISFIPQCIYPGIDTTITLTSTYTLATGANFNVDCAAGMDLGVLSVVPGSIVFPGTNHTMQVLAGNLNNWYNLNCPVNMAGTVQVGVSGPVSYVGPAPGALMPVSTTSNVFTYTLANFNTINPLDFQLIFNVNTTAQAGNNICASVTITPVAGDNNPQNNIYQDCYTVVNSFDPNYKETNPVNVLPAYSDWFNYTIHFQNTGTAPAMNIKLQDTLSTFLNVNTFEVINHSHPLITSLNGNKITFSFANINLADSTSNPQNSTGFVQYRIKPYNNLPAGTQIKNRAYIYFDYNAPVVTNTSLNNFVSPTGLSTKKISTSIKVYPNPTNGLIYLTANKFYPGKVELISEFGQTVYKGEIKNSEEIIDISAQPAGIYFVRIVTEKSYEKFKIVKE